MASIVEELNSPKEKEQKLTKVSEYKACIKEYEEIIKENLSQKPSSVLKKSSARFFKPKKVQEEQLDEFKIKLSKVEDELISQVKNYETSRQKSYTKCVINFLINNIEYHGQAVDNLLRIMDHFVDSEKEVQAHEPKPNRFLRMKA